MQRNWRDDCMGFAEWLREEGERQPFGVYVGRLKFFPDNGEFESEHRYLQRILPFVLTHVEMSGNANLESDFRKAWEQWIIHRQTHCQ